LADSVKVCQALDDARLNGIGDPRHRSLVKVKVG
jgi:hypothetical protein